MKSQMVSDLESILAKQRKYASFFEWPDRVIMETGIVRTLCDAMERASERRFTGVRSGPHPNQAPDCVALNLRGRPVAIEVSELVSPEAIRLNQKAKLPTDRVYMDWEPRAVVGRISEILAEKDAKTYHAGPFWSIVVVIHCDEFTIKSDAYLPMLNRARFGPFRQINEVYFLFSYEPDVQGYPYTKLFLKRAFFPWRLWLARSRCWLTTA